MLSAYIDSQEITSKDKLHIILRDICKFDSREIKHYMDKITTQERAKEILRKMELNIRQPCEEIEDENKNL